MKKHTMMIDKKGLVELVNKLTEENQRCFLGILEALMFAQTGQGKTEPERRERPVYPA
jgi:hypothetical protein